MSEIFISYKREDEVRVGRLAKALQDAGLSIWWDRSLAGGENWRSQIENELDAAKCVIGYFCPSPKNVHFLLSYWKAISYEWRSRPLYICLRFGQLPYPHANAISSSSPWKALRQHAGSA